MQDALANLDVPIGYAVVLSSGYLGPTAALAIMQVVFGSVLISSLKQDFPGINLDIVKHAGATDWKGIVPMAMVNGVLKPYNHALAQSWYVAVALACISLVFLFGLKWYIFDSRFHPFINYRSNLDGYVQFIDQVYRQFHPSHDINLA